MKDWRAKLEAIKAHHRQIRDYMKLPYTYEITGNMHHGWFVRVVELPGCMSQGLSPGDAYDMIREAMTMWFIVALEDGDEIPLPEEEE